MVTTVSPKIKMSLQDFLEFEPQTDLQYELEDGELREMPPESDLNQRITSFLFAYFLKSNVPFYRLRIGAEIAVIASKETVRVPDLMVLSEAAAIALEGSRRSTILLDMPAPELVVEVVSPGQENINRDYRYKRAQYQARGINEYWIVDPIDQKITILTMNEGLYDEAIFTLDQAIISPFIKTLTPENPITVTEILQITT